MTAPLHPREAERLAVLAALEHEDGPSEAGLDALVRCAAQLTGAPVALISLIGEDRQWACARHGDDGGPLPREHTFCAHAILQDGLFEVPDALLDGRFADNPPVIAGPRLRFYAGQPLLIDGLPMGTLCVIDRQPRRLSAADRETLAQLGAAAVELLQSRRRLREAARQRERLLDFARAAGDWMWESDAEHRLVWVSEAFEAIVGQPAASRLGRPLADLALLDEQGRALPDGRRFGEVLERRTAFSRALVALDTARGRLAISRSAVPAFDDAGRFIGYRGTARDMTGVLAAEAEARRSAALLRELASQVPGALFVYHERTPERSNYPYLSDGIVALTGLTPELLREDAAPFMALVHPDDHASLRAAVAEAGARNGQGRFVYRLRRTDGQWRWLESTAVPTRLPDSTTLWHGFAADITERQATEAALREHEQRWQLAATAAGIGIAQFTLVDGRVHLDERACANHGIGLRPAGLELADWAAQIDPADRDTVTRGVQQAIASGTPFESRYRVHRADGQVRWLEFVVRATHDAEGGCTGLIGTCRDVHEQQIATDLQRAKNEAENASRAKTEFLSRVSHELRTPLNAILGFAQLMALDQQQPLTGEQQKRLASVARGGRHLLELINDVLDLTRIESADFSLQLQPVDLGAALRSSAALVQPLAEARGIRLDLAPAGGHWARGDARAIEQVLMNLLSNAIKYGPGGQPVTVTIGRQGDEAMLEVHDRGAGLSAAAVARLFEPFERLGADKQRIEGSGLGLVIARELAQAMGGRVSVASAPGAGSTFGLHLAWCEAP
ncbi:MAG TPA: PAS domain-containing protein, partial [Methylibium sp.]|nr:PAS domain-containing protein [Methylibium sp.]